MQFFVFHFTKYYYNPHTGYFQQVEFRIENLTNKEVIDQYMGGAIDVLYQEKMRFLYDKNVIAIPERSTLDILINEILNPFNLFQVKPLKNSIKNFKQRFLV